MLTKIIALRHPPLLGTQEKKAFHTMQKLHLYQNWLIHIKTKYAHLCTQHTDQTTLRFALDLKNLLYKEKKIFFKNYYRNLSRNTPEIKNRLKTFVRKKSDTQSFISTPSLISDLETLYSRVKKDVLETEKAYFTLSKQLRLLSELTHLFTETPQLQSARAIATALESATPLCSDIPVLQTKLSPTYLQAASYLPGSLVLTLELISIKWLGLPPALLQSTVKLLTADITTLIELGKKIHCSEKHVIQSLPYLEWTLGLGLNIGLYLSILGFSSTPLLLAISNYTLSTSGPGLMDLVIKKIFKHTKGTDHPFYPLAHTATHLAAYLGSCSLHKKYLAPLIQSLATPTATDTPSLLTNRAACLQQPDLCLKQACSILDIPPTSETSTANKAYHKLIYDQHPDRGGNEETSTLLNQAIKAFRKLKTK
jgi:hypothetical protein